MGVGAGEKEVRRRGMEIGVTRVGWREVQVGRSG